MLLNSKNCLYTHLINAFSPTASICEQQQSFTTAKKTLYSAVEQTTKNRCRLAVFLNINNRARRASIEEFTLEQLRNCENCQQLKTIIQQYCIETSKCHYDQNGNTNALIHTLFTAFMYAHTDRLEIPHHVYLNAISSPAPSTTSTWNRPIGINKNATAQMGAISHLDQAFNSAFERHVTRALNHRMQGFNINNQEVLVGNVDYLRININGFGAAIPTNSKYVRMGNFGTDGELKGLGSIHWHHGGFRCGQFYQGVLQGYGVNIHSDGSYAKGMFKSGKLNGKGVRISSTLGKGYQIQTGTFGDGRIKNGYITFYNKDWSIRQQQKGNFVNLKLKGPGVIKVTKADGSYQIQDGTFENGELKNGSITFYNEHGNTREQHNGNFVGLQLKGTGVVKITNADGSYRIKDGTFENGKLKNGSITHYNEDGIIQKQQQGNFVGLKLTGKGTITYKNGTKYEGHFSNGKLNGIGFKTLPTLNGGTQIQDGTFNDGVIKNGSATFYNKDRSIRQRQNGNFEDGKLKNGSITDYNKDESVQKKQHWDC